MHLPTRTALLLACLWLVSAVVAAALGPRPALAAATAATEGVWINYTSARDVGSLAIDPTDGVWVGTSGGAVRWDSQTGTYTKYTTADGLASNLIYALVVDSQGNKWFGTFEGGVSLLASDGTWHTYTTANGLAGNNVYSVALDSQGNKWFGTMAGASRLSMDGAWHTFRTADGLADNYVRAIASDSQGNTWFGTGAGVSRLASDGTWRTFTTADGLADNGVSAIAIDGGGNRWFGTGAGVSRLASDGTWRTFTTADGLADNYVTAIASDSQGNTWFGTLKGVSRLAPDGTWRTFTTADGLADNGVSAIAVDSRGNRWFGTGPGVSRLSTDSTWRTFRTADGLADSYIDAVAVDNHGNKWFGTNRGGVNRLASDGTWRTFTTTAGLADSSVMTIVIDNQDTKWFGTFDGGVSRLAANGSWRTFTSRDGLGGDRVQAIASDSQGNMWFGTDGGVSRLAPDGTWRTFTTADGLAGNFVPAIKLDNQGNMWFGTDGGVSRLASDGTWRTFTTHDGLADNGVSAIAIDSGGNRWFGTGAGVSRLATDGTWRTFTTADGLADNGVSAITSDSQGNMWFGTNGGGVSRLKPDGTWRTYTRADGLADNNITDIAADSQGNMWFGTIFGVARQTPLTDGSCGQALALDAGIGLAASLATSDAQFTFRFTVPNAFSRVELTIADPQGQLELALHRSCTNIGLPEHIGLAEHIGGQVRLVFDVNSDTGDYYLVVNPAASAPTYPIPYHLHFGLTQVDTRDKLTLILTDKQQLQDLFNLSDADVVAWRQRLDALAAHPAVRGLVIDDIENNTSPTVHDAYAAWVVAPTDPGKANDVALALRDWLWTQRQTSLPRLQYVVLAGDDRVIPSLRIPISGSSALDDGWQTESAYANQGKIGRRTTIGSALSHDLTLTDDVYGARQPQTWGGQDLHLPELAVGRLVETPSAMTGVINAFLARNGVLSVGSSLAAGYSFMKPSAQLSDQYLKDAGLPDNSRDQLIGDTWTADQLRAKLLNTRHDLTILAVHAAHYALDTPDRGEIQASAITTAAADLQGALAYAVACHGGLNVPGADSSEPVDFPETWLAKGGMFIGSTGWAYGLDAKPAYDVELMADFTKQLIEGDGSAVGDALIETKQSYYKKYEMNRLHLKTLAETALYGLPMYRVQAPHATDKQATALASSPSPAQRIPSVRQARPAEMSRVASDVYVKPDIFPFPTNLLQRIDAPDGSYYTFNGTQRAEGGEPFQPKATFTFGGLSLDGRSLDLRGVVLHQATYHAVAPFTPLIQRADTLGASPAHAQDGPVRFTAPGWYPSVPVALTRFDRTPGVGQVLVAQSETNVLLTVGQYNSQQQRERLFDTITVDEYYSASADHDPPTISSVTLGNNGQSVQVQATDLSGIAKVIAVYDTGQGSWGSVALSVSRAGGIWSGTTPGGFVLFIQAVDNGGNVALYDMRVSDSRLYLPLIGVGMASR